jgi:hypothetical protein
MISTSVKPALRTFFIVFIVYFAFFYMRREQCDRRVMMITICSLKLPVATATIGYSAAPMPTFNTELNQRSINRIHQ